MLSPSKHQEEYDNPFANSTSIDPFQDAAYIEPDLDLTGQSTVNTQPAQASTQPTTAPAGPTGSSTSTTRQSEQPLDTNISAYSGQDTLDEPVTVTIVRLYPVSYILSFYVV